jgi:hypothetical protein
VSDQERKTHLWISQRGITAGCHPDFADRDRPPLDNIARSNIHVTSRPSPHHLSRTGPRIIKQSAVRARNARERFVRRAADALCLASCECLVREVPAFASRDGDASREGVLRKADDPRPVGLTRAVQSLGVPIMFDPRSGAVPPLSLDLPSPKKGGGSSSLGSCVPRDPDPRDRGVAKEEAADVGFGITALEPRVGAPHVGAVLEWGRLRRGTGGRGEEEWDGGSGEDG